MSTYLYTRTVTPGLPELASALEAKPLRKHDGMHFLNKGVPIEFKPNDTIICWGSHIPPIKGVKVFNPSFHYPTQLEINTVGLVKLRKLSLYAFNLQQISLARWKDWQMPAGKEWYPTNSRHPYNLVPMREFEGYATSYYRFKTVTKSLVFCGKIVAGEADQQFAIEYAKALDLEFAEMWFGTSSEGVSYLLKVITAPPLSPEEVKLVSHYIEGWRNVEAG